MAETIYQIENADESQNREKDKRTTTDSACLVVYSLFVAAWIGIAIYAYSNSRVSPIYTVEEVFRILWKGLFVSTANVVSTWFCALFIVSYFALLRWCTKFVVYLTIFLKFFFITLSLALISVANPMIVIPITLISYILFWIEIQILKRASVQMICTIVVDSCKAFIACPLSLMIALLCLFMTATLCLFVGTVIYCLSNQGPRGNCVLGIFLIVLFMFISFWILLVNSLSMLSALHGTFTSWCNMKNKYIFPKSAILRHLFYAYRYHIGSFAFMSIPFVPIIQIVRIICVNIRILKMKFKESPYNIYCFLAIILYLPINTSIVCASRGKCYYPSMKDAFTVLVKNSMKFTAIRLIISGMLYFGLILVPGTVIGLVVSLYGFSSIIYFGTHIAAIYSITIIITCGIFFIFSAAVDSVLFYHLEELLKNSKATDESFENN